MIMELIFQASICVLCIVNNIVHGVGMWLLKKILSSRKNPQMHLIFNLSLSEFIVSCLEVSKIFIMWVMGEEHESVFYVNMFQLSGLSLLVNFMMIFITLDRLAHFLLNLQYSSVISIRRTKFLCWFSWSLSVTYSIVCCVLFRYELVDFDILYKYQYPSIGVIFLISASITYSYIAYKCCIHRRMSQHSTVKMKMYLPTLLIATYVLLQIVPDLIYLLYIVVPKRESSVEFNVVIWFVYMVSLLSDGLIYIFVQENVRQELFRLLGRMKCQKYSQSEGNTTASIQGSKLSVISTHVQ